MAGIPVRTAALGQVTIGTITLPDGTMGIAHVLVDGNGVPFSPTHPLLTAPAIKAADFTGYGGTVASAGGLMLDVPADPTRTGGFVQADVANAGKIIVTLIKADGTTQLAQAISPGGSLPLTTEPGSVFQQRFTVAGDTQGDKFTAATFQ